MKMYKVKDQEEAVKNAKLFCETVKFAWGLQITYCYHDLIHMIKNDLCYDLYDSDNGWSMGLGVKNQNDADVCTLAEILKEEDDDEDDTSEKEEERKNIDNDNETKATDEILKKIISQILKIFYTLDFLLQCQFRSTHCRRIYSTLCTKLFKPQESPQI